MHPATCFVFRTTILACIGAGCIVAQAGGVFPATIELSGLDGRIGFVINGIDAMDRAGASVGAAGDVNGDGVSDVVIGAPYADAPNAGANAVGEAYVVYGQRQGWNAQVFLADLDGSGGAVITGIDGADNAGGAVGGVGDINGDGADDVIIGAANADTLGDFAAGEGYVVFGRHGGLPATLHLSTLNGSNGFALWGADRNDLTGGAVSGAGDVNGDGNADIVIGAKGSRPDGDVLAGRTYVVFGRGFGFGFAPVLRLGTLSPALGGNGSRGFILNGAERADASGTSVSELGDVNGDGVGDLIVGAPGADPDGRQRAGTSYVVFGQADALPERRLSSLDGSNGFAIHGVETADASGWSVSDAGDVNGDGIDDILIGARLASPDGDLATGAAYVIFGRVDGFPGVVEIADLDGRIGFAIHGADEEDLFGNAVTGAGDLNADGLADIAVGAFAADPNGDLSGATYVVFGRRSHPAAVLVRDLDGSTGFVAHGIAANDRSGGSVSGAGDVNGDGVDDLIIGASGAALAGQPGTGQSYVLFGRRDSDTDGVSDLTDNCTLLGNPLQQDADGDGFGNACDPDLNNDNRVNALDLGLLRRALFTSDPVADFNSDGRVNFVDLAILNAFYLGAPGPSADL